MGRSVSTTVTWTCDYDGCDDGGAPETTTSNGQLPEGWTEGQFWEDDGGTLKKVPKVLGPDHAPDLGPA